MSNRRLPAHLVLSNDRPGSTLLWLILAQLVVLQLIIMVVPGHAAQESAVVARVKPLIQQDGLQFKDLNSNGVLDPYEDWRLSAEERAANLVSLMTLNEKVAQMQHPTFIPKADGSAPSFLKDWAQNRNVGFVLVRDLPSARAAAQTMNQVQEWCEASRLGIPIVVSMDSVHGLSYVNGGLVHPHNLGLAATRNVDLVRQLTEAVRLEHLAIGVRMTLSPEADIATEPRWGRVMETFGEDPDLVSAMVKAQVEAYQAGTELSTDSVLACVKHFPGAGPQMEGIDMAPIVATAETLEIHLKPFVAAIESGVGAVMPYYSIPLAIDMMAALGSEKALQGVLRGELGFEGIIQTDWGMIWGIQQSSSFVGYEITQDEAIRIGIGEAKVDGVGGESMRLIDQVVDLVEEGKISEDSINASVQRILEAKFKLGIFENPYVDPLYAERFVGNPDHQALSLEAARQSMTLLKNEGLLPLKPRGRVLVAGLRAGDMDSLTGGWTSKQDGITIVDAIRERIGVVGTVMYEAENPSVAAELAKICDVAIVVVGEPSYMHSPPWGASTLELTSSQAELLRAIDETGTPMVVVVMMGRPYILTWCNENAEAILCAYYPGTQGGKAIAEVLFGDYNPSGKLPVQLPRSMSQVLSQRSDLPFDIEDPLFDFGYGLSY